jgi:hypothetical protein
MATSYGPRRLNAFTITMLLVALGAGYWVWRFFPVYFDAWSVDHILKEGATAVYQTIHLSDVAKGEALKKIVDKAKNDIVKRVGIQDPELVVNLEIDEGYATMSADYSVTVFHPVIEKKTLMHLHRERRSDVKAVKWE